MNSESRKKTARRGQGARAKRTHRHAKRRLRNTLRTAEQSCRSGAAGSAAGSAASSVPRPCRPCAENRKHGSQSRGTPVPLPLGPAKAPAPNEPTASQALGRVGDALGIASYGVGPVASALRRRSRWVRHSRIRASSSRAAQRWTICARLELRKGGSTPVVTKEVTGVL